MDNCFLLVFFPNLQFSTSSFWFSSRSPFTKTSAPSLRVKANQDGWALLGHCVVLTTTQAAEDCLTGKQLDTEGIPGGASLAC